MSERPAYLEPYARAAEKHGAGFGSLLWASPATQAARFEAICSAVNFPGKRVLDVGCGRADFWDYLNSREIRIESYVGIEGVAELAEAARRKVGERGLILEADFLAEPHRMFVGAEIVVISGALNTLESEGFYSTLRRAFEACGECVVFNFLCSDRLAGASYLRWHGKESVLGFARTLGGVEVVEGYLGGDCTIIISKAEG